MIEIPIDTIWPGLENATREREYILRKIDQIGHGDISRAVEQAALSRSKSPLDESHSVGVAIVVSDRGVFKGHNTETKSNLHGIQQALSVATDKALKTGTESSGPNFIHCIAVVQDASLVTDLVPLRPALDHSSNSLVICANQDGKITTITSLNAIFPKGST